MYASWMETGAALKRVEMGAAAQRFFSRKELLAPSAPINQL
jgi:hypothetical protein